jgi:predicted lipid carrier protein YhbT
MDDLKIKLPKTLEDDKSRLERQIEELIASEEKSKKLLNFIDELMKGVKNLIDDDLIKLGRELKKGRGTKHSSVK